VTELHITIRRTRYGKTQARITGRSNGATVDVTVTGWRRASVLAEAQATFDATAQQAQEEPPVIRTLLLTIALLLAVPAVAGAPGHHTFNDTAVLDTTQVVDTRDLYGELVCRVGDVVPDDCEIDLHPADES
jgi:hypothetical protein